MRHVVPEPRHARAARRPELGRIGRLVFSATQAATRSKVGRRRSAEKVESAKSAASVSQGWYILVGCVAVTFNVGFKSCAKKRRLFIYSRRWRLLI